MQRLGQPRSAAGMNEAKRSWRLDRTFRGTLDLAWRTVVDSEPTSVPTRTLDETAGRSEQVELVDICLPPHLHRSTRPTRALLRPANTSSAKNQWP